MSKKDGIDWAVFHSLLVA